MEKWHIVVLICSTHSCNKLESITWVFRQTYTLNLCPFGLIYFDLRYDYVKCWPCMEGTKGVDINFVYIFLENTGFLCVWKKYWNTRWLKKIPDFFACIRVIIILNKSHIHIKSLLGKNIMIHKISTKIVDLIFVC